LLNPDFRDMLGLLCEHNVEFLLVGAHALAAHGHPRATGDLDIWVRPTKDNAVRLWQALEAFGAPLALAELKDFHTPDMVVQFGVPPRRIDLITGIDGVNFTNAWNNRITISLEGMRIPVIGRDDLIHNKRSAGRPKDALDADTLEDDWPEQ
jgi:hypothetical protein